MYKNSKIQNKIPNRGKNGKTEKRKRGEKLNEQHVFIEPKTINRSMIRDRSEK